MSTNILFTWGDYHSRQSNALNSLFIYEFNKTILFCWTLSYKCFGRVFQWRYAFFYTQLPTFHGYMSSEVTFKKKYIEIRTNRSLIFCIGNMWLSDNKKIMCMGGMGTKVVDKSFGQSYGLYNNQGPVWQHCGTINIPPSSKAMFCSPSSVMATSLYSGGSRNFKSGGVVPARYKFMGSGDCFDALNTYPMLLKLE